MKKRGRDVESGVGDIGWCQETIPRHLLTIDDAEMLKKVVLHSVATAFASIV